MESLLNRYRNLTVLLLVLVGQLLLLAYQIKSNEDVRLIRTWAVTGVMPLARILEGLRSNTIGALRDYGALLDAHEENQRLKKQLGSLKMENQFLKSELSTADRARALAAFQSRLPSRTVAARVIGTGTGANSMVVFLDRGANSGVGKGMAVVTPDGIVGRVIAAYPSDSQVVLITDPRFRAGVVSQRHRIHGTLKGQGHSAVLIDFIQNEDDVVEGEWFFTSGHDRVFPKGLQVGQVKRASPGRVFKQVDLVPVGLQNGLEEVLVVIEGVHQELPSTAETGQPLHLLPPPPPDPSAGEEPRGVSGSLSTDADHLLDRYRQAGQAKGIRFGDNPALAPAPKPPSQPPAPAPPDPARPSP